MICRGMERGDDASRVGEATFLIPYDALVMEEISRGEW